MEYELDQDLGGCVRGPWFLSDVRVGVILASGNIRCNIY